MKSLEHRYAELIKAGIKDGRDLIEAIQFARVRMPVPRREELKAIAFVCIGTLREETQNPEFLRN